METAYEKPITVTFTINDADPDSTYYGEICSGFTVKGITCSVVYCSVGADYVSDDGTARCATDSVFSNGAFLLTAEVSKT
jgi:hypothetical protein